jgi:hypothetical protein
MSAALHRRLGVLEIRLLGRTLPPLPPGRFAKPDGSEFGAVYACMAPEQPKLSGWPDFASKTRWLDRQICAYAEACSFSKTCIADGRHPSLATKKDAELN